MPLPITWLLLALSLAANTAAAQSSPSPRQRQDRRAALPTTSTEPVPEVYVAAGHLTTVAFNGPLDRDSLVVDRTRFKWLDVGDRSLSLEPFTDLGPGERLVLQVGFRDKALPTRAVLAVVSKADVVDGKLEVDRRANTPESLLAALAQKEAELEELQLRCEERGAVGAIFAHWLTQQSAPQKLWVQSPTAEAQRLRVTQAYGYRGETSSLLVLTLLNPPDQLPWELGQTSLLVPGAAPMTVLSVTMRPVRLAPGEQGDVVVETKERPWATGQTFQVVLTDVTGAHRLAIHLVKR